MSIKERIQLQRLEKRQSSYARWAIVLAVLAALCMAAVLVLQYRAQALRGERRSAEAQPNLQEQQMHIQARADNLRLEEENQALLKENETLQEQIESLSSERDQALQDLQAARQEVRQARRRADWRRLRQSQAEGISETLKELKGSVLVASVPDDPEALQYARQLHDAIKAGGWLVQITSDFPLPSNQLRGLAVLIRNSENPPQHAGLLQQALEKQGIRAPGGLASHAQADVVLLVAPRH
ncbi:MAG TPA: hypothetical protein VLU25_06885 [Acidobacteriota bacterium]|nr:hypothetical protein [Acidobacteriota bacterium]